MTFTGVPRPYQQEAIDKMVDQGKQLLGVVMGAGKGHPDGTPILTPNGFVNVEELSVGDLVIGADGLPTSVTGIHPRGVQPCYKVSFNDHTSTIVDAEHLWYVESPSDRYHERQGKVIATWMLATDGHVETGQHPAGKTFPTYYRDRHGNNRWSIPIASPVEFASDKELPIDPYTLGVILGDGSIGKSSVLIHCHADDANEMVQRVVGDVGVPRANGNCWAFSIRGLLPHLRDLGLMGMKTETKFVPDSYLFSSPENRLALLQGLMDTDGFTGKRGTVEFSSTSTRLAEAVCFLARSLGGYAYMRPKPTTCTYKGEVVHGTAWRVTFKLDYIPFRLTRKATNYGRPLKYKELRVITDVQLVEPRFTTCISVAAEDHLYVIHDFIVTHNTVMTIATIEQLHDEGEVSRALIIVPTSLKYQWLSEIKKFSDARATVIDGSPKERKNLWRFSLSSRYTIINPELLSRDIEIVNKQKFDAVVVDECTMLKNRTTDRSKIVKKVSASIFYRFALTGQPIENRPEELFCADAETEVLSRRGWLRHDQLTVDDVVLTLNHETGMSEWQKVEAVNEFNVVGENLVRLEHRDHSSLTTVNHRWPVVRPNYSYKVDGTIVRNLPRAWTTTETLGGTDRVPVAAACSDMPLVPTHPDALVELVAWLYTEGHIRKNSRGGHYTSVNITQNPGTVGAKRIEAALTALWGAPCEGFPRLGSVSDTVPRWRVDTCNPHSTVFKLNTVAGAALMPYAPDKVPSYEFLLSLTKNQLDLFIEVSMLADNNGHQHFSQKAEGAALAFQFACTIAGIGVSIRQQNKVNRDRDGNDYQMTNVCVRKRTYFAPGKCRMTVEPYTGVVWCPTTPNRSWFARRNGTTYFTGNSIMEFVDKTVLGDFRKFDSTFIVRNSFGKPIRYRNLDTLFVTLGDCLFRKTRADIADQLPKVIHQTISVPFDPAGAALYRKIAADLLGKIQEATTKHGKGFNLWTHYNGGGDEAQGQIMSRLTVLRMLCDNPQLVSESSKNFLSAESNSGSQYAADLFKAGHLKNVKESPKLKAVLAYIEEVLEEDPNNKVVLFSFFKSNLKIIQDKTKHLTKSVLFMGGMNGQQREESKQQFRNDPDTRLFLSSDAGGYGVDLPMANHLISFDLPWSSGKLEQREARIIRLSSEFPHVTIATFVMHGSIEERQHAMLLHKRKVNEAFVDGKHDGAGSLEIDLTTLSSFLRFSEL